MRGPRRPGFSPVSRAEARPTFHETLFFLLLLIATPLLSQEQPKQQQREPITPQPIFQQPILKPAEREPTHDISMVDDAGADGAISTPLPVNEMKRLRKYDLPELAGSRQALGSQLVGGELPRPLVDYIATSGPIRQRLSIFEGGLVVVDLTGSVAPIRKKLLIPNDALQAYLKAVSPAKVLAFKKEHLNPPKNGHSARVRVYESRDTYVDEEFNPLVTLPKIVMDVVAPLQDLMRAICEDRSVTNSVANYEPKEGDELVSDDRNVYRVVRVVKEQGVVQLRCLTQPTSMYVKISQLYNYFIGKPSAKSH
jgi:hypothetical protein